MSRNNGVISHLKSGVSVASDAKSTVLQAHLPQTCCLVIAKILCSLFPLCNINIFWSWMRGSRKSGQLHCWHSPLETLELLLPDMFSVWNRNALVSSLISKVCMSTLGSRSTSRRNNPSKAFLPISLKSMLRKLILSCCDLVIFTF